MPDKNTLSLILAIPINILCISCPYFFGFIKLFLKIKIAIDEHGWVPLVLDRFGRS